LPLSEKARIEVYIPDLPIQSYKNLLDVFYEEFTFSFGGCTIVRGLDGSYLSKGGTILRDRVNLVYTDTPYTFENNFDIISHYVDQLCKSAFEALDEEAILIVVYKVYHSG